MDIQNGKRCVGNAAHGRDHHPLADQMTKLKNFTKEHNRDFSAFRFSLQ